MEWNKVKLGEDASAFLEGKTKTPEPTHELKILSPYFRAVLDGSKTFEIRNNADRGFQKGDTVLLREIENSQSLIIPYCTYSGRSLLVEITYVTGYEQKPGYVVFSFVVKGRDKYGFVAGGKKSSEMSREDLIDVLLVQTSIIDDLYDKTHPTEKKTEV